MVIGRDEWETQMLVARSETTHFWGNNNKYAENLTRLELFSGQRKEENSSNLIKYVLTCSSMYVLVF
jgi:hypothetical protein